MPRVTPGGDLGTVLANAVAMSPVSMRYAARGVTLPAPGRRHVHAPRPGAAAGPGARAALDPALARAVFGPSATPLTGPLVADQPSETAPLPAAQNYINWLVRNGLDTLRTGAPPGGANTLLFALLRHALLRAYANAALRIVRARGLAAPGEGTEPGLDGGTPADAVGAPGRAARRRDRGRADARRPPRRACARPTARPARPAAAQLTELMEVHGALRQLLSVPTAALARYTGGVLDLASHRLDAWVSAMATRRLAALRTRKRRSASGSAATACSRTCAPRRRAAASHGYIHAPSLGQAATAAVLRSGHLAHLGGPDEPLALDLSSRRVRLALALLDGVRAGQPLGALLGYRLERGLHEGHPGLALDRYIAALRGARSARRHHRGRARPAGRDRAPAGAPAQVLGQLRQQHDAAKATDTALKRPDRRGRAPARRGAGAAPTA